MEVSNFHTTVSQGSRDKAPAHATPSGNAYGVFAQTGEMSFLDLLFGQIGAASPEGLATKRSAQTAPGGKNPLFNTPLTGQTGTTDETTGEALVTALSLETQPNPLAAAVTGTEINGAGIPETAGEGEIDIAAANLAPGASDDIVTALSQDPALTLEQATAPALTSAGGEGTETLASTGSKAKGQAALKDILATMLQGMPEETTADFINLHPGKIKDETIDLSIAAEGINTSPALIATNLSPDELAGLIDGINGETAQIVGLVKILPPQAQRERILMPRAFFIPGASNTNTPATGGEALPETGLAFGGKQQAGAAPAQPAASDDVAAQLNALTVGADETAQAEARGQNTLRGFAQVLEIFEDLQQQFEGFDKTVSGIEKAMQRIAAKQSAGNSTIPAQHPAAAAASHANVQNAAGALSGLFSSAAWENVFPEGMDWGHNASGGSTAGGLSLNGPAGMTSLISHAPHATQGHPASQTVAATITRVASGGEAKNITIRLDPPDLGKVEIRFEFGENKALKAKVIVEKPETHLMLQRDAHLLERALQDAGLDADDSSLSFELDDGSTFNQDANEDGSGQGQAQSGAGAGDSGLSGDETVIETTMDLAVNPDSGLMQVNILV